MSDQSIQSSSKNEGRSRAAVAVIASLVIFGFVFLALWAFTTIGLMYALATATPTTIIVACGIVMLDWVGDFFAAIVEAIMAAIAAVLAALAAVFGIFGG